MRLSEPFFGRKYGYVRSFSARRGIGRRANQCQRGVAGVSRRIKHVVFILLVQTGCFGIGLWMQHHFVLAAAREQAVQQAWKELESDTRALLPELNSVARQGNPQGKSDLDIVLGRVQRGSVASLLLHADWSYLTTPSFALKTETGETKNKVHWRPLLDPDSANADLPRGTFEAADGIHIAVAYWLEPQSTRVVVHRPRQEIAAATGTLLTSLGGLGLLTWVWTSILLGISTYMVVVRFHEEAERERGKTVSDQLHQRQTLLRTRDAVIFGLAKLADSRDPETGDHLERISVYSTTLASVLRHHPKYAPHINSSFLRLIGISSALHDIGKVGIEDRILLKPGPLTPVERARIQAHAEIGGRCLREIEQRLGSSNFLQMAREIAIAHHERWDGTGYPNKLRGEEIPLAARIVAIADVYDALSSRRVYKGPRTHEDCVSIISEAAGKHFDPDMTQVWLSIEGKFREIARRYADSPLGRRPNVEIPSVPAAQEAEFDADRDCLVVAGVGTSPT